MAKHKHSNRKFPLHLHTNGQWAKKINGKRYYFGTDKAKALERFKREVSDLYAGTTIASREPDITVRDICNRFIEARHQAVDRGEITLKSFGDYVELAQAVADHIGDINSHELRPIHFNRMLTEIAQRWGPVRRRRFVGFVKSVFKWATEEGLISHIIRYGPDFRPPPKRLVRQARRRAIFAPGDISAMLDNASIQLRAMILLGINGGLGNTDIALLPLERLDFDNARIV